LPPGKFQCFRQPPHAASFRQHLGCETGNLPNTLTDGRPAGLRPMCISPATPAPLFGGRPVFFYNVIGMGLIEILESKTRNLKLENRIGPSD